MKIREEEEAEERGVNLTPMIDVVFLLIIFFMVSTTFIDLETDLEIDLPEASSGESTETISREMVVSLLPDGRIYLDDRETTIEALTYALQRAAERDPKQVVIIRGDKAANFENAVQVVDACKIAKITNVALRAREEG